MSILFVVLSGVLAIVLVSTWQRARMLRRAAYIRTTALPSGLFDKLRKRHASLSAKDCHLVAQALRQFFMSYLASGCRPVSMPSQVVDDLWHEFILHTKNYEAFCGKAFGRFLHHTPATALGPARAGNAGLRRCFWFACKEENIRPREPSRLPLLFAIDAKLAIPGGFHYVRDCASLRSAQPGVNAVYCAGDFSDGSFAGGTEGFGEPGSDGTGHGGAHGGHGHGDAGGSHGGHGGDGGGGAGGSSCSGGSCGGGGCGGGD